MSITSQYPYGVQVWRSIRAPRKPGESEVFATIDTLWQDLMSQGGMSQADIDETASMGLSGQDAQRLEAVSTACKVIIHWIIALLVFRATAWQRLRNSTWAHLAGCCT